MYLQLSLYFWLYSIVFFSTFTGNAIYLLLSKHLVIFSKQWWSKFVLEKIQNFLKNNIGIYYINIKMGRKQRDLMGTGYVPALEDNSLYKVSQLQVFSVPMRCKLHDWDSKGFKYSKSPQCLKKVSHFRTNSITHIA